MGADARYRANRLVGLTVAQIGPQLHHILRKAVFSVAGEMAPQSMRSEAVRARGTPQTQVDPARVQRGQRAELLGDHERRVVGQHHATGADPNLLRATRNVTHQDCGCRTRHPVHVVMFRDPIAVISPALGVTRQIERVTQRLRGIAAFDDGAEIENGKWLHGSHHAHAVRRRCPHGLVGIKPVGPSSAAGRIRSLIDLSAQARAAAGTSSR